MNQSEYLNESALDNVGAEVPEKPFFSHSVKIEPLSLSLIFCKVTSNNFSLATSV